MTIKIYPEDLVKLGVWDSYSYYVVGSDTEAEKQLLENKEFEITETDALVIGLLKVIETNNLIHRLNGYITDFLTNKSSKMQGQILIRKKSIIGAFEKFRNKYPTYWKPSADYAYGLKELDVYIKETLERVEELEVHRITIQFGTFDYLNSNQVKKLLKFNYQ
jgi:hypothetical protein